MNIGLFILMLIGGSVGIFSTLYIVISLPATIAYKVLRKAKSGVSLFQ